MMESAHSMKNSTLKYIVYNLFIKKIFYYEKETPDPLQTCPPHIVSLNMTDISASKDEIANRRPRAFKY
jgi:hypothetical protein